MTTTTPQKISPLILFHADSRNPKIHPHVSRLNKRNTKTENRPSRVSRHWHRETQKTVKKRIKTYRSLSPESGVVSVLALFTWNSKKTNSVLRYLSLQDWRYVYTYNSSSKAQKARKILRTFVCIFNVLFWLVNQITYFL